MKLNTRSTCSTHFFAVFTDVWVKELSEIPRRSDGSRRGPFELQQEHGFVAHPVTRGPYPPPPGGFGAGIGTSL